MTDDTIDEDVAHVRMIIESVVRMNERILEMNEQLLEMMLSTAISFDPELLDNQTTN